MIDAHVLFLGCGAAGGNLAEHLARAGLRQLTLLDRDRVAPENLGLQPYDAADVGRTKVRALADRIGRACPDVEVVAFHGDLAGPEGRRALASAARTSRVVVVDALDNAPSRALACRLADERSLTCLHVGLSADGYAEAAWDASYPVGQSAGADPCRVVLGLGLCLVLAAAATKALTEFFATGVRRNFAITWGDLRVDSRVVLR